MLLTRKAQYAVQALIDLTRNSQGKPVTLKDIACREEIPLPYLEQLFFRLKKGQLVRAIRGPGGGYLLARTSATIKLSDIIATVEESFRAVACMDAHKECDRQFRCSGHGIWHDLAARITSFLDGITLEELAFLENETPEAGRPEQQLKSNRTIKEISEHADDGVPAGAVRLPG